jgi:hypothetical protein
MEEPKSTPEGVHAQPMAGATLDEARAATLAQFAERLGG